MNTRLFHLCLRFLALMAVLPTPWAATASTPSQQPGTSIAPNGSPAAPDQAQVETALRSRPPLFVPNTGQFDPRVRFQLRGGGRVWWFTDDALWLTVLEKPAGAGEAQSLMPHGRGADIVPPRRGVHLKLSFPGMSPTAHLMAADPQPGKTNYFLGNDASRWRSNVPTYGMVRWEGVYPGVNLAFGRGGTGLGLTVESASDAALAALRLRIEGADAVRVDAGGRLIADTAIGPVALPPWLTSDGTPPHPTVVGDRATFATHPFNPFPESPSLGSEPALNAVKGQAVDSPADDPSDLLCSTFLGGSDHDSGYDIASVRMAPPTSPAGPGRATSPQPQALSTPAAIPAPSLMPL